MTLDPPHRCAGCGTKSKNMKKHGGWLAIPLTTGVFLMACPNCHIVHLNRNALANLAEMKEKSQRRIVTPDEVRITQQ